MFDSFTIVPLLCWVLMCASVVVAIVAVRDLVRIKNEGKALRDLVRTIIRRQVQDVPHNFQDTTIRDLWSVTSALVQRLKQFESKRSTFDEVLSVSAPLAESSNEPRDAAEAVIRLILDRAGNDIVAMGVVLRDPEKKVLELVTAHGVPKRRLEDAVLMSFDPIIDRWSETRAYRKSVYMIPERGSLGDFSVFGVGLSLYVPLRDIVGVCGGIWIGLKHGTSTLSPQRKTFIQALSEYAAASFYAARKAQDSKQRSDSERDFLLGMSHDLRAPGNSAIYALKSILSGDSGALTAEQHMKLSVVEKALEEQLEMLGDVLDYAKHQKGFLCARGTSVRVDKMVNRCVEHFQLVAEGEGLVLDVIGGPEEFAVCDARHFQRIISNYLSNAIKYTDRGKIEVSWSESDGVVEILVSDTGIGVPEEDVECLFQEFRRCENGATRQGVGLGLALSKVLAELNCGQTFFRPNPEGGSTFGLRLPASDVRDDDKTLAPKLRSILVVDDDAAVCRTNIRYLKDCADRLAPAGDVTEAKELLESFGPDLVVSDLYLGKETAEELIQHISERFADVPVVLLSGSSDAEKLKKLRDKHGLTVLEKPVSRQVLQDAVVAARLT